MYEKSKGFFEVIGHVGDPIAVGPGDDLEAVFENAQIVKATKVQSPVPVLSH